MRSIVLALGKRESLINGEMGMIQCCVVRGGVVGNGRRNGKRGAAVSSLMWENGKELSVSFLDGDSPLLMERVKYYAGKWSDYCGIDFRWVMGGGDIRITFQGNGSWSYLGKECLSVSENEPTMCFGWLKEGSLEQEIERVVLHEFGHALGLVHEHQNPEGGIDWNRQAVYDFYAGSPNYWSKEEVDVNVLQAYEREKMQASVYDAKSIMNYPIPVEFVNNPSDACGWNLTLSEMDKVFIGQLYPKKSVRGRGRVR